MKIWFQGLVPNVWLIIIKKKKYNDSCKYIVIN